MSEVRRVFGRHERRPLPQPFRRMELRVPEYYKWVTIGLSVGVSLLLSIRLGYMGRAF